MVYGLSLFFYLQLFRGLINFLHCIKLSLSLVLLRLLESKNIKNIDILIRFICCKKLKKYEEKNIFKKIHLLQYSIEIQSDYYCYYLLLNFGLPLNE